MRSTLHGLYDMHRFGRQLPMLWNNYRLRMPVQCRLCDGKRWQMCFRCCYCAGLCYDVVCLLHNKTSINVFPNINNEAF
ncbi:hypothetical protein DPMN_147006 [Dreissena polymorpha]|uniref:Uncharacterized protein n=1 Tax=Dreissena polymorpha TaxID=45954 RepID=A0A9D4F6X8_DREPO|nr:hypothetical protein DPMN_147006 [Dreissena polymorpha]